MSAVYHALSPVELQLTEAQEDAFWIVWAALEAAEASGDTHAKVLANLALLDWKLEVGLLSRATVRRHVAPHLLDLIATVDAKPEGRPHLQKLRDDALEALNGDDYDERTAAALFILCVDGVQNPRRHETRRQRHQAARNGVAFVAENAAPCLESGHWAPEDVECHLAHAVALLDRAEGGSND